MMRAEADSARLRDANPPAARRVADFWLQAIDSGAATHPCSCPQVNRVIRGRFTTLFVLCACPPLREKSSPTPAGTWRSPTGSSRRSRRPASRASTAATSRLRRMVATHRETLIVRADTVVFVPARMRRCRPLKDVAFAGRATSALRVAMTAPPYACKSIDYN
jgi:hypothetical protein